MNKYKIYLSLAIMLIMTACSTTSVSTGASYRSQSSSPVVIENADPLDVSIAVFNPGIPVETDGEYGSKGIYPELRRAEAMYMAVKLRDQLSDSKSFGAVSMQLSTGSRRAFYDIQLREALEQPKSRRRGIIAECRGCTLPAAMAPPLVAPPWPESGSTRK